MSNSFAVVRAPALGDPARNPKANSSDEASFPGKRRLIRGNFRQFLWAPELVAGTGVSYRGTPPQDKMPASIRFPARLNPERFQW
jgi:hypothetical protein